MLHLYNQKANIPSNIKYIRNNVEFFLKVTHSKIDERVNGLLKNTDGAIYYSENQFIDRFGAKVPWINLSTGGMTVLNVFYNEDCCFDTIECGTNALTDLKNLKQGYAYPDYITNFDNIDEIDVIIDDWEDYHYTSFERYENE